MKFLIVNEAWEPQNNGVVRTYQNLRRELVDMGHKVYVMGPQDFFINMPCPAYPDIRLAFPLFGEFERKYKAISPDRIHIATEGVSIEKNIPAFLELDIPYKKVVVGDERIVLRYEAKDELRGEAPETACI